MLASSQARPRSRGARHLREVGSRRRGRSAASPTPARSWSRRAARSCADLPVAPLTEGLRYERPFARPPALDAGARARRRALPAPADLGAALAAAARRRRTWRPRSGSTASTITWCASAPSCARAPTPPWSASSTAPPIRPTPRASRSPPTATRASAALDPYEGARLAVAEAYRNLSPRRRRAARRHRLPQLRQPRAPRGHVAARRGHPRPRRRLPRARDAGRLAATSRSTTRPTGARSSRRRRSAWSASSPTPPTPSGPAFEAGCAIALLGVNTDELGGSEYLDVVHGKQAGVPPRLDLARELAVGRACRALVARAPGALGARLLRGRARRRARRVLHPAGASGRADGRRHRQARRGHPRRPAALRRGAVAHRGLVRAGARSRGARHRRARRARRSPSSAPPAASACRSTSSRRASSTSRSTSWPRPGAADFARSFRRNSRPVSARSI